MNALVVESNAERERRDPEVLIISIFVTSTVYMYPCGTFASSNFNRNCWWAEWAVAIGMKRPRNAKHDGLSGHEVETPGIDFSG